MLKLSFLLFFIFTIPLLALGQVTIGLDKSPSKAATLELKTQEATNDMLLVTDDKNVTSDKGGLGLPRVKLENKKTLEPFIEKTDADWLNATSKVKEKHTGMMVYNIHVSADTETAVDKMFNQGVYVWNGEQWTEAFEGRRFFPCPAFNLPLSAVTRLGDSPFVFNLYEEYEKQFTKGLNARFSSNNASMAIVPSPASDRLYAKHELDYVVTYYDDTILEITEIDKDGVMTYNVKNVNPKPTAFVNITFVIKE